MATPQNGQSNEQKSEFPRETKIFNDPIHGSIELDPVLVDIIDTPQFQRLRRIKQLGVNHLVYPGAVHTRFAHSIGVCHIAGEMIIALQKRQPEFNITDEDVLSVKVAALCHDLGHGPFSHTYDSLLKEKYNDEDEEKKKKKLKHEYRSCEMYKKICEKNKTIEESVNTDLVEKLILYSEEAKEILKTGDANEWKDMGVPIEKCFLFEIVANGISGIDVDKMDYFARDSHGLGLSSRFDWRRYIQTAKIMKVEDFNYSALPYHICSRDKEVHNLYELFHMRQQLHKTAYQHKTAIAAELMAKDIFKKAGDESIIEFKSSSGKTYSIIECWQDMDAFLQLDDSIIDILWFNLRDREEHKELFKLIEQFRSREIQYKHIEMFTERYAEKTPKDDKASDDKVGKVDIMAAVKKALPYDEDKIKCEKKKFDYGKGEEDPLKYHFFYGKHDAKGWLLEKKKPKTIPSQFKEEVVHAYYIKQGVTNNDDELNSIRKRVRYH